MATFNKFNVFVQDLGNGVHNFGSHSLKVMFTNTAPVATNTLYANLTDLTTTGGYTAGGAAQSGVSWTNASGTSKLLITDYVFTASGAVGPFRYVVLYNDTPSSPAKPLIGWYDYGSSITLQNGDSLTIDYDGTNGVITLA